MGRITWFGLIAITAGLAGCAAESAAPTPELTAQQQSISPGSIAESEMQGPLPTEAITAEQSPVPQDSAYPFPRAGWLDGGNKFAIVLAGSSSCPSFPSSIEVVDAHHLVIGTDRRETDVCSADMAPRTHVLVTPKEIDRTHGVTIEYSDGSPVMLPPL
ncbi:hypothetical protein GCM10027562_12980 [Arthrobacter pigmenti]